VIRGKAALGTVQVTRFEPASFAENESEVLCVIRFRMRVPSTGKSGDGDSSPLGLPRWEGRVFYRGTEDAELTAALFAK
jgi:hypothetical protein